MSSNALVWLSQEDVYLILEGLGALHSDYEGTSSLPTEQLEHLMELEMRLANIPGYKGTYS